MALSRALKASSSKMSPSPSDYDVFLSFRGEDTRNNFTGHLYTALVNARVHTYRDNLIEKGENIQEELEKAIQHSRSSVIVFSTNYTSSRWCLDELVMILERRRTSGHVVLPVFYDIDPSFVRKQAESLSEVPKYQQNQSSEKINGWRAALGEVADLAGMVLANEADRDESEFIKRIVRKIQDKLAPRVPAVPLSHVQEVLQKKLLSINPDLDDAEGKQLKFQTSVKPWLHELKEAVFDAEDLLQEIKTEALRQEIEKNDGSSMSKVPEVISTPSHAFNPALIYGRAEEVLDRLEYNLGQRRDVLGMEASAEDRVSQAPQSTSLVEPCVYGRDEEKETFVKLLLSDYVSGNKIGVIPIVGMAGIGKTTLAQFLYNDVRVEQHFDLQAWACISKEFDILTVSRHIYESLTDDDCRNMSLNQLQTKLQKTLKGKRFFLVLDDIWNNNYDQWEILSRPFQSGAHGSKIIVTTRDVNVARMMGSLEDHNHLRKLAEEVGWSLFKSHAFTNASVGEHSHLEAIGREIIRKCDGLPLAIKSLGGLLRSKFKWEEWESVLKSDMWELPPENCMIMPSLWLSYRHLPRHLKQCFAYCSLFPKNYQFQKSKLVLLWKAQGFLQPNKNKMVEAIGEEYFNDLFSRSFFEQSSSSNSKQFIMHDLFNDLANFVSGEFSVRWEKGELPSTVRQIRHFSYMEKHGDSFAELEAISEAEYVRTLLPLPVYKHYIWSTFSRTKFKRVLCDVLPKLQCLRVLNLSMYDITELPDSISNLKHLRHLDMSETPIKKLPDSICTLYNLQALLLCRCRYLAELPTNLGRLINLSHLDIENTTNLERMPPHMDKLKALHILPEFVLDEYAKGQNAIELKNLQNLRGTLRISGLENVVDGRALVAHIVSDKQFLTELKLNWKYSRYNNLVPQREVLEKLQPPLNLEMLQIENYGGNMFPGWSGYYFSSALVHLVLTNCGNCISLPPLGQLPSLTELHISGLEGVVSIGSEFYYGDGNTTATCVNKPFRSLKSLSFVYMTRWERWCHVGGDDNEGELFPNLKKLSLRSCWNLTGSFAVDRFPMLNEVELIDTELSLVIETLQLPNLTHLDICRSRNIRSLPKPMKCLPPSLQYLRVPSVNLQNLKCLRELASLEELSLDFSSDDRLQGVDWLPCSLTHLMIQNQHCQTMHNWFGHLNNLRSLTIWNSEIGCLPGGLPSSLSRLDIKYCPWLAERCRRDTGVDWPKIAHIPIIMISEFDTFLRAL